VPSASLFSKSMPSWPIVLVMWTRQRSCANGSREGVERGRLHLDPQNRFPSGRLNRFGRLAKRRVGRPGGADDHAWSAFRAGLRRGFDKAGIGLGEFGRRGVMVARPFVAQRSIGNYEIGWRSESYDLTSRSKADEQPTAAREQFFRHENCERSANDPSDNAYFLSGKREGIQFGMIAWPACKGLGSSCFAKRSHKVAVGIQQAHGRHQNSRRPEESAPPTPRRP
jgi:hypothetical protein